MAAKPVKAKTEAQSAADGAAPASADSKGSEEAAGGKRQASKKVMAKDAKAAKDAKDAKAESRQERPTAKAKSKKTAGSSSKSSRRSTTKKSASTTRKADSGDADIDDLLGGIGSTKKKAPAAKRPAKKAESKPKKVAAASGGGKGRLTKRDIQKVVRASGRKISRCATRIPGPPGQKVKIEMRWEIRPNGRVAGASVLTGKFKNHSVGRCVLSALKSMRFPAFDGKPIKIGKYPFGLKK